MPFTWTPESERNLLLVAISQGNVQPGQALWNAMIQALGNGVTDRAVRYLGSLLLIQNTSADILALPSLHHHTLFPQKFPQTHALPKVKSFDTALFLLSQKMSFTWNSEADRTILLLAMGKTVSFHKASPFCAEVASFLGGGVTPNAVRYIILRLFWNSVVLPP